jgi:hypothetical protein
VPMITQWQLLTLGTALEQGTWELEGAGEIPVRLVARRLEFVLPPVGSGSHGKCWRWYYGVGGRPRVRG